MTSQPNPMFLLLTAVGAAVCLAWPLAASSAEQRISCPANVEPASVQVKAPTGWHFAMPQAARLTGAGMLHGAPEESAYLVPDDDRQTKQGGRSRWTQRWRFDRPHWYKTYVYCAYDGALQLFYAIPENATECTATGSRKGGSVEGISFVCK